MLKILVRVKFPDKDFFKIFKTDINASKQSVFLL